MKIAVFAFLYMFIVFFMLGSLKIAYLSITNSHVHLSEIGHMIDCE